MALPTDMPAACFATTHWSVVLDAGDPGSPSGLSALEALCRTYWFPVYAQVRRQGYSVHEAPDLTQEFFAGLLKYQSLGTVRRERGRFRTFLLKSLRHFLCDQGDRRTAQKRGGGVQAVPIDALGAEERLALDTATHESPDVLFDRHWLQALMDRVFLRLREEQVAAGRAELFDRLKPHLGGDVEAGVYAELEVLLGLKRNTIAANVARLRHRCRELALAEVRNTVADPAEAEAEFRQLLT